MLVNVIKCYGHTSPATGVPPDPSASDGGMSARLVYRILKYASVELSNWTVNSLEN